METTSISGILASEIAALTGNLLTKDPSALRVKIVPPTPDSAKTFMTDNRPGVMTGTITLSIDSGESSVALRVPMPFHDVFLRHNEKEGSPITSMWNTYLRNCPGFRRVRAKGIYKPTDSDRIFFNSGNYWDIDDVRNDTLRSPIAIFGPASAYPQNVAAFLLKNSRFMPPSHDGKPIPVGTVKVLKDVVKQLAIDPYPNVNETLKDLLLNTEEPKDHTIEAGDITFSALDTFWTALIYRLPEAFLTHILDSCWQDGALLEPYRDKLCSLVASQIPYDADVARVAWAVLKTGRLQLSAGLIDPTRDLEQTYITNEVDAAALRTLFSKTKTKNYSRIPVDRRQNHPSSFGHVCPVQTPESKRVGLVLHLARGAKVDPLTGRFLKFESELRDAECLGHGAGLVPFFQYNDGARNMMAAKNLRQALPLKSPEHPLVPTRGDTVTHDFVQPLVDAGICPQTSKEGRLTLGRNLLVAYLPWYGLNCDDAIVVGKHVVEDGWLSARKTICFRSFIPPGHRVPLSLPETGKQLNPGACVLTIPAHRSSSAKPFRVRYPGQYQGTLTRISYIPAPNTAATACLTCEVEMVIPLGVGDKLMGRHGNKGVVGHIESKMPHLPIDDRLGGYSGRPIDILLNPHGVVSRMNLGQLLETQIGWLLARSVPVTAFSDTTDVSAVADPFSNHLQHEQLPTLLANSGLDAYGRATLSLASGKTTRQPVFVGVQHFVRLRQVASLKAQARGRGRTSRYSTFSGQPVHGRRLGGGQKVGEMEIWALAAHQVQHNLKEVLTTKSQAPGESSPWSELFSDVLYAMGLKCEAGSGKKTVRIAFAPTDDVYKKSKGRVVNAIAPGVASSLVYACKGHNCNYQLAARSAGPVAKAKSLRLGDVLRAHEMTCGILEKSGRDYLLPLLNASKKVVLTLSVTFEPHDAQSDTLEATLLRPHTGTHLHFPETLHVRGRFPARKAEPREKTNITATGLLLALLQSECRRCMATFLVVCPGHKSLALEPGEDATTSVHAAPGSLYDPMIFGSTAREHRQQWGHIELPVPIPFPMEALIAAGLADDYRSKLNPPELSVIPVLPLAYRSLTHTSNALIEPRVTQLGYSGVVRLLRNWNKLQAKHGDGAATAILARRVFALFRLIAHLLKGKEGVVRAFGLGKRVDYSARLVIVPAPKLLWNQTQLPVAVLIELFFEEFATWLKQDHSKQNPSSQAAALRDAILDASWRKKDATNHLLSQLEKWTWKTDIQRHEFLATCLQPMREFLKQHTDHLVLLNRQPTLHKYGFMAFHPVVNPDVTQLVIGLHPLACSGFNADFDGDEMAVHRPLGSKAVTEATSMLPDNNLLSIVNGSPVAGFEQDFVLGTHLLSQPTSSLHGEFRALIPEALHSLLPSPSVSGSDQGRALMKALCQHTLEGGTNEIIRIISDWFRLAAKACTEDGVSFGFEEIRALSESVADQTAGTTKTAATSAVLDDARKNVAKPGHHFAVMVLSGARGEEQAPQLISQRGELATGDLAFDLPPGESSYFPAPLVQGVNAKRFYISSLNARSSMCDKNLGTARAGYLGRRLILACWPVTIRPDCQTAGNRAIVDCKAEGGVCQKCFGVLPDGSTPPLGYPIGLIAAQAMAERGTQLSMQSFHTAQRTFSIRDIELLFRNSCSIVTCSDCAVMYLVDAADVNDLRQSGHLPFCQKHGAQKVVVQAVDWFSPAGHAEFKRVTSTMKAYRSSKIDPRMLDVVWRIIRQGGGSLHETLKGLDFGARISWAHTMKHILDAANGTTQALNHPVSAILFE